MNIKEATKTEKTVVLTWGSENFGNCEADFLDNNFEFFVFREIRSSLESRCSDEGIRSRNLNYLRELYKNLGELLGYIDKPKIDDGGDCKKCKNL